MVLVFLLLALLGLLMVIKNRGEAVVDHGFSGCSYDQKSVITLKALGLWNDVVVKKARRVYNSTGTGASIDASVRAEKCRQERFLKRGPLGHKDLSSTQGALKIASKSRRRSALAARRLAKAGKTQDIESKRSSRKVARKAALLRIKTVAVMASVSPKRKAVAVKGIAPKGYTGSSAKAIKTSYNKRALVKALVGMEIKPESAERKEAWQIRGLKKHHDRVSVVGNINRTRGITARGLTLRATAKAVA